MPTSPAARIVKLAIVAAVLYLAYTEGLPWLQSRLGRESPSGVEIGGNGAEDGTSCVGAARDASAALGAEIGRFARPPVDLEAWAGVRSRLDNEIYAAEAACRCSLESCLTASQALGELRSLVSGLDGGFRGGSPPPNPARQQAHIDELLDRARDLARDGS